MSLLTNSIGPSYKNKKDKNNIRCEMPQTIIYQSENSLAIRHSEGQHVSHLLLTYHK